MPDFLSKAARDKRANQLNPNNAEYKQPAKAPSADLSARSPSKRPR